MIRLLAPHLKSKKRMPLTRLPEYSVRRTGTRRHQISQKILFQLNDFGGISCPDVSGWCFSGDKRTFLTGLNNLTLFKF